MEAQLPPTQVSQSHFQTNCQQVRDAGSSESIADIAERPDSQIDWQAEVDDQKSLQSLKSVLES